mmetsp:Transcript_45282/g.118861  ORF Transcript_45282/g.118861 Transcript_45282/m.118861 type:complete len:84 (-) Transcript_45282:398-649(-)
MITQGGLPGDSKTPKFHAPIDDAGSASFIGVAGAIRMQMNKFRCLSIWGRTHQHKRKRKAIFTHKNVIGVLISCQTSRRGQSR